ncbi:MAG: hypothetical protein LUP99_03965 [Methanomicrobiales archaeon]|nr:hypothetical protein [Methanomicrobiales archaeon]
MAPPHRAGGDQGEFGEGWRINYIRPAIFENRICLEGTKARLASITKSR